MDETEINRAGERTAVGPSGHQPVQTVEARMLWDAGVQEAPEFTVEPVHLVTGTILPIWGPDRGSPEDLPCPD